MNAHPTNNALLINFRLSSDAEILLTSHRLSLQMSAKRAMRILHIFQPSFHFAYHRWWLGMAAAAAAAIVALLPHAAASRASNAVFLLPFSSSV